MEEWLEITVVLEDDLLEAVADLFFELGAGGVVLEDPAVVKRYAGQTHPDEWGAPVQQALNKQPAVKAYLPVDEQLKGRLAALTQALTALGLTPASAVKTRQVREEDWANAWKAYYKPIRAGQRLVIKPSWETWQAAAKDLVVELDPGQAFGSGDHATTLLALELLEEYLQPGGRVIDVGAGSGILAIAAAKLGAGRILAVDLDPVACRVALANVERNQVEEQVRVVQGDLLEKAGSERAQLIVANIIADVIIQLAPAAERVLAPRGVFIASGIIRERRDQVAAALRATGLALLEERAQGPWVALVGEKG